MYKINDLKKLKKAELLSIIIKSNRVDNLELISKQTKVKLLDFAITIGLCGDSNKPLINDHCDYSATFTRKDLFYKLVTDELLLTVIAPTFEDIYLYSRNEDTSYKNIDRAVKHSSAGDVSCLSICEVFALSSHTVCLAVSITMYFTAFFLILYLYKTVCNYNQNGL